MLGTFAKLWGTTSTAANDSLTSRHHKSATRDDTMDSDGSGDVSMISESVAVQEERPESSPRASDAQFISRDAFEVYKQKQARDYSRLNDTNLRLQKLDQSSREKIKRLVNELALKTEEAEEAQMGFYDTQVELNACQAEQMRLEGHRIRDQAELATCKSELTEWRDHFHNIGKDLQSEQKAHEATQRELQDYKAKYDHTQVDSTELQALREKVAASQQELSACKDDLFRLQPIAQIPDSDIFKEFDFICQQIVDWIDMELLSFEQANPHLSQEDFFSVGGDIKLARRLQKDPELGEYLIRRMIHCYLEAKLLGQNCSLLGLTQAAHEFLQSTERSMTKLDPPRDPATISAWRSETLKAIARTEESRKLGEKKIRAMTVHMFKNLSETFPVVFGDSESMERFHEKVMQPASKLATMLRGSYSTYRFEISRAPFPQCKPLTTPQIKGIHMIDVKTRMTLKPTTGVVGDKNGVFGKCIMMLEPHLSRVNKGKEDTRLRQGVYLVELDHPIAERK